MNKTKEDGTQYEHSLDHALEFFSKAGSMFTKKDPFYGNEESALSLFQKTWIVNKPLSFKLLLWLRDCRGGAGNRSGFRECLEWLSQIDPKWINSNIEWIPEVGRWDDLGVLFNTRCESFATELWARALREKDVLAAKWANRKDSPLKHKLGFKKEGDFRKFLAGIRKEKIVEHKMSTNRWNEIAYHTVPSLAMTRYTKAFGRHDSERFTTYKESLKKGETNIHSSVLFPHDCVRTVLNGDCEIADAQFYALPNYLGDTKEKIIVLSDTSASMDVFVSGSIKAVHISQGMALYCSAKIPENNPFHKKFIGFCSESSFKNWGGKTFSEAVTDEKLFDGAVGRTRIDKAFDLLLNTAKFFKLTQDQLPTTVLIVSDMQFTGASSAYDYNLKRSIGVTEVNQAIQRWIDNGYNPPKIVYWNTSGYAGSPETAYGNRVALVSGFSPSILKAIFSSEDLSPIGVMKRALEKYNGINIPKD